MGPKSKTPLTQQGKIENSHGKAPIPDQPVAEVVSQRNAVFLTNEGRISTFPPGAATASSGTYLQESDVTMGAGTFKQPFSTALRGPLAGT